MNSYDKWKQGGYKTERNEKLYTEEQLLLEQIDILESNYKEKVRHCLYLQNQLKTLAVLHRMESTFGGLTIEEQQARIEILKMYENETE